MSNKLDFEIEQGEDFRLLITLKSSDGELLDLTGRTYLGLAKESPRNIRPDIEITLTIADQSTNKGELHLLVPSAQTSKLKIFEAIDYLYDVKEVNAGESRFLLNGKITVVPRVSK